MHGHQKLLMFQTKRLRVMASIKEASLGRCFILRNSAYLMALTTKRTLLLFCCLLEFCVFLFLSLLLLPQCLFLRKVKAHHG